MENTIVKLTQEIKAELTERLKSKDVQKVLKAVKEASDEDTGRFKVVIATNDRDRMGEVLDIGGMDLKHFKNNPVVLFGHDYRELPVAIADKITKQTIGKQKRIVAEGRFAPASANPKAQQIRELYDLGFQKATSVGFIPKEWDEKTSTIKKSELLEFSFVTVPANPHALTLMQSAKMNVNDLVHKGLVTRAPLKKKEEDELTREVGAIMGNLNTRINDEIVKASQQVLNAVKTRVKSKKSKAGKTGKVKKTISPPDTGGTNAPVKKVDGVTKPDSKGDGKRGKKRREMSPGQIEYLMFTLERSVLKTVNNVISEALADANKKAREHFAKQK